MSGSINVSDLDERAKQGEDRWKTPRKLVADDWIDPPDWANDDDDDAPISMEEAAANVKEDANG